MPYRIFNLFIAPSLFLAACAPIVVNSPRPALGTPTLTLTPLASQPSPTFMQNPNLGTLIGHVTIGPLQPGPVRSNETPRPIPPEVYAARTIQIFSPDGATLVTNVKINPDGTYTVMLSPGNYLVNLARTGIDRARDLPKTITLESGKTIQLDIDIDTGIR